MRHFHIFIKIPPTRFNRISKLILRYLISLSFRLPSSASRLHFVSATILFCLASSSLHAAPSKKDKEPPIEPSVGYDTTLEIHRGDTKAIILRAIPSDGYDVEFEIITQPRYGTLSKIVRNSKGSVALLYSHQDNKNSTADSFKFKIKTGPRKCWSTKTARIQISEPPARLELTPETLDFGSVFIGESATLPIKITNSGGGFLRGAMIPSAESYSIIDSNEFDIPSGKSKTFAVTFAPKTPDIQPCKIRFESDVVPRAEISAQGIGSTRFEAPIQAAFDTTIEPFSLSIEIANRTAEPLPISIQAPHPLHTLDKIELPPNGTSKLELKIQTGFFSNKFSSLLLSDGAFQHPIKIQLPPPPSVLVWEAPKLDLGDVITGTSERLIATLHNCGTSTAKVKLVVKGDGLLIPEPELTIPPEQSIDINANWTFASLGNSTATIAVDAGGHLPPLTFRANVQEPRLPTPSSKPLPASAPLIAPKASSDKSVKLLTKEENAKRKKRIPTEISYRLEQHLTRAKAVVSWIYTGPQPPRFTIEVETLQRADPLSKPFEDRLQVPNELPETKEKPTWQPVSDVIANIHQLPDGRWQATTHAFKPGFHHIRIGTQSHSSQQINYCAFVIEVPPLPALWMNNWLLGALFFISAGYLLRHYLMRLLHVFI